MWNVFRSVAEPRLMAGIIDLWPCGRSRPFVSMRTDPLAIHGDGFSRRNQPEWQVPLQLARDSPELLREMVHQLFLFPADGRQSERSRRGRTVGDGRLGSWSCNLSLLCRLQFIRTGADWLPWQSWAVTVSAGINFGADTNRNRRI